MARAPGTEESFLILTRVKLHGIVLSLRTLRRLDYAMEAR